MRVIAGSLGGRRLAAPGGRRTRPTSDRVREALFMALEPLAGARVVDLFAGSGALGIEALSRGAEFADFVESDRAARAVLHENRAALGLEARSRIWPLTLPGGLTRLKSVVRAADLVLLDPPYGGGEARAVLEWLGAGDRVAPAVRVVVEHHARDDLPERVGALTMSRTRQYGETVVRTYAVDNPARASREAEEPR